MDFLANIYFLSEFHFVVKFPFLAKISLFTRISIFGQISIFSENFVFYQNFHFWPKYSKNLANNFELWLGYGYGIHVPFVPGRDVIRKNQTHIFFNVPAVAEPERNIYELGHFQQNRIVWDVEELDHSQHKIVIT